MYMKSFVIMDILWDFYEAVTDGETFTWAKKNLCFKK